MIMEFKHFALSALLLRSTAFALDCSIKISRVTTSSTACDHFSKLATDPYHAWINEKGIEERYNGMTYMAGADPGHPENGAAVHWKVDDEYVHIAVAVRSIGWVGFGIGEAGGMIGADMVIFEAVNPDKVIDAYTNDARVPQHDDCPSDWELVSSVVDEDGGFLMVEVKRLLDTNDPQDKPIFDDSSTLVPPHRVIAAWGDEPQVSYHGLNRARGAIRFYGSGDDEATFIKAMQEQAEDSFVISSIDHEIAQNDTEYAYTCLSREDLLAKGLPNTTDLLNIIGFEPIIQEGNEAYVHHYILYADQSGDCASAAFMELAYVWAPGEGAVNLPRNLGTPLFGGDGFQAFMIEVHYNNPQLLPGIIDSSGVRVYWTSEPRDHQIGILSTGDPIVGLYGQPVGDGPTYHSFECPHDCSSLALADQEPVTVLREYLHMHATGEKIVNEQIRDGETIRRASIEYWEFDQNGNAAVQQKPFKVQAGDSFRTSCYFNGNGRVFGMGSDDEMCMAFLYYYPRTTVRVEEMDFEFPWFCGHNFEFSPCATSYESRTLGSVEDFGRAFGVSPGDECPTKEEPDNIRDDSTTMSASKALVFSAVAVIGFSSIL